MKKILILTYYWPPSGGSGVQRWMYFAKHLKDLGHHPVVVTVDPEKASYKKTDDSLLSFVDGIETHTTNSFEILGLYSRLSSKNKKDGIPQGSIENKNSLFQKVARFVRGNFFIPDSRIGWNKYALKKCNSLLKNTDFDFLITTGPPHSTHLIGSKLKKENKIQWIADFRDPWTEVYYNNLFYRTKWALLKDKSLEKKVIDEADLILTVGKNMNELLQLKSKQKSKFKYIFNGFNAELFNSIPKEESKFFEITFAGLLSNNQPYKGLIEAIKMFVENNPEAQCKVVLAGSIDENILLEIKSELKNIPIDIHGYIPHNEVIMLMKKSSLLTTVLPKMEHSKIMISGKIMEYLATGNPILMFGQLDSEASQMISRFSNTLTFEDQPIKLAVEFIEETYSKWKGEVKEDHFKRLEQIGQFSREETAKQLSDLLLEMTHNA